MRAQGAGHRVTGMTDQLPAATVARSSNRRDHPGVETAPAIGRADGTGLLERSSELSHLHECITETAELRRGQVVLVSGEAGIGKTALLRQFRASLPRRFSVLWGTCDPLFTPRPLGPLLEPAAEVGGELAILVEGDARPHEVAGALLAELRGRAPSVLVLEDLHHADEATLDVVRLTVRRIESVATLLALSFRDDCLDRDHPLQLVLGELPGHCVAARLRLTGLSRSAVRAIAQRSALDPDDLYARTAGNPFYVTESLAAGSEVVPATVRDAVLARVARLSPAARDLLDAVAVVPQRVEVWLLEAMTDGGLGALEECLRSGVLRAEADGVVFRHELARLAVEDALSPDRAVSLHRRALAALGRPELGAPDLTRLAHHAEAAGDGPAVLRYAPAAGEHAASLGAPREAQYQYLRALRFAGNLSSEERAPLLERFADHAYLSDMRSEAADAMTEVIDTYRRAGDQTRRGDALVRRARLLSCIGRAREALEDSRESVRVLELAPPGPELARAYSGLAFTTRDKDPDRALVYAERAIDLAERLGATGPLVHALNNAGIIRMGRGEDAGRDLLVRSIALALQEGLGTDVGRGFINLASCLGQLHRWTDVMDVVVPGIEYCREHGLEAWTKSLLGIRGEAELALGRWDAAAETAAGILAAPRDQILAPRLAALIVLALVRARRGDPEHRPLLDEARQLVQGSDELDTLFMVAAARAEVAWLEGRPELIAEETDEAFTLADRVGDGGVAGELSIWRRRGGLSLKVPSGALEHHRRLLTGDWAGAAGCLRDRGSTYDAALALTDSGEPEALREALDEFRNLGARAAEAIVARRLRELGERGIPRGPRARTRANAAGLTSRELEVLPLLAAGLRNAEIADRLIVSPKTVDHHVSSILRKLDVRTRGQAGAAAARLGLTQTDSADKGVTAQ
jgi:DNA-binding CsgD family transcriptional regulator/tetratricopeptide (TPR) repeat protein